MGAVFAPRKVPVRAGITYRTSIETQLETESTSVSLDTDGARRLGNTYLPQSAILPWEMELGFAFQLGPRPLNARWDNPDTMDKAEIEAERLDDEELTPAQQNEQRRFLKKRIARRHYAQLPRAKVLVSTGLVITGRASAAVGVESCFGPVGDRSGESVSLTPRLGVEVEPVERWTQVRAGSYLEPSRFESTTSRLHGTIGLEQKLFPSTVFGLFDPGTWFRVTGVIDIAREYFVWGVTAGVWH